MDEWSDARVLEKGMRGGKRRTQSATGEIQQILGIGRHGNLKETGTNLEMEDEQRSERAR